MRSMAQVDDLDDDERTIENGCRSRDECSRGLEAGLARHQERRIR